MRKIILIVMVCLISQAVFSQVKFGLEVTPFNINRLNTQLAGIDASSGTTIGAKLVVDNPISESAFISTGIEIMSFKSDLAYSTSLTDTNEVGNIEFKSSYIVIPISLKLKMTQYGLFTPFAQVGFEPGFSFGEKITATGFTTGDDAPEFGVRAINIPFSLAAGTEYQLSDRNAVYASLFYKIGLTNVIKDNYVLDNGEFKGDSESITLNNFGLRIGILF